MKMGIKDWLKKAKEELYSKQLWKSLRAEFFGSILYVIFGCGCLLNCTNDNTVKLFASVLSFGIAYSILVRIFGPTSGGHFNPAVTISLLCTRYISLLRGLFYILVQIIGSICGAAILYGIIPSEIRNDLGVTKVHKNVDNVRAFGVEFLATFIVIFTYFTTLENKNNVLVPDSVVCGLSISLSQLFAFNLTGASINPARSLGPALIHNSWDNHWIYWVGPILGSIFGGFTHEYTNKQSADLQNYQTSLRQHVYSLQRKEDGASSNSLATELACDQEPTEELQI
ncbi:aquaporin-4-like [Mytilus galloprovincialis]|uniref:aquaporin-4-like n=1 Tax=Mytilus galloprovincialis TaxID=29158 RepID=UPI003F7C4522